MRTVLAAVVLAALAPLAGAQFSAYDWTINNGTGCLIIEQPNQIIFGGGNSFGGQTTYATQLRFDALVTMKIATVATPKGDCGDSNALYGTFEQLNVFPDCSNAQVAFAVPASSWLVIGHDVHDNTLPGDSIFSNLFLRPFWTNVGFALYGEAGEPLLQGSGVPSAGKTVKLEISGAAPSAPTTLVIGATQAGLPFKGGLLVPQPNVLLGLVTSPTGGITLSGHWPAGVPAGVPFWMQAWIADAGGPKGFAATNAVQVFGI